MEFVSFGHYWLTPAAKRKRFSARIYSPTAGVYLPEGRHSIIPINCERSEPMF
jgi:hypothetical protein